jgi:hypothetical protein
MLMVFEIFCVCSFFSMEKGLERYRREFSTEWSMLVVITIGFSNRFSFYKEHGVYYLWGSFSWEFASNLVESRRPKKMTLGSESSCNSASFDKWLKVKKDRYGFLVGITIGALRLFSVAIWLEKQLLYRLCSFEIKIWLQIRDQHEKQNIKMLFDRIAS